LELDVCKAKDYLFKINVVYFISQSTIFIYYLEIFLEHQIIILEWFLKGHVTLKTGVMMLHHRN